MNYRNVVSDEGKVRILLTEDKADGEYVHGTFQGAKAAILRDIETREALLKEMRANVRSMKEKDLRKEATPGGEGA